MTIFISNFKRILRTKSNIIFMIIFPIILIVVIIGLNTGTQKISLGVVDNDNTKLTKLMINDLSHNCKIYNLKETDIKKSVLNFKSDYVIVIPKNFTKNCLEGKNTNIKGYGIKETNSSEPVKLNLNSFIGAAKTIGKASKGNEQLFYKGINKYYDGVFNIKYKTTDNNKVSKRIALYALGFLVFNMLMLGTNITPIILKDKKSKVYYRILSGPIKVRSYTLQNLLSFFTVVAMQVIIIFAFIINVYHIYFSSLASMILLFMVFSMFVVAFALFISSNSKDLRTASVISTLTVTPLAMLGGCFWPRDIMPPILQNISKFVPVTWVLTASEKLIYGSRIYDVFPEISILLLFTLVFILLASWRKKDILN